MDTLLVLCYFCFFQKLVHANLTLAGAELFNGVRLLAGLQTSCGDDGATVLVVLLEGLNGITEVLSGQHVISYTSLLQSCNSLVATLL